MPECRPPASPTSRSSLGRISEELDPRRSASADRVVADSRSLASLAARAAASKQGEAVVVLDMRDLITITDYFVIAYGLSKRRANVIADEAVSELNARCVRPL